MNQANSAQCLQELTPSKLPQIINQCTSPGWTAIIPNHEEMPEGQQVNPVRPQPASVKVKN
jgi:hypothetical protein